MVDRDNSYDVGYAKPPRSTRFGKGQSGNPKGRPKGSQNPASVLAKVGRERVKVTGSNGSRSITKIEASVTQLSNQAASGQLRAIREFLFLIKSCQDEEQSTAAPAVPHERDKAVMESILRRIRQSVAPEHETTPAPETPSSERE